MREKTLSEKRNKEKYKFLAVVAFFLVSGILYSHSFYGGTLNMGRETTVDQLGVVEGELLSAEDLL